jgi:hypothetical protein
VSSNVELLVSFSCWENDGVAALAVKHLATFQALAEEHDGERGGHYEAREFLKSLAGRSGRTDGSTYGISAWCFGGNYTQPELFAEILRPVWDELLRYPVEGGPLRMDHVLVLYQLENEGHTGAVEIFLDLPEQWHRALTPDSVAAWPLVMRTHANLPFGWRFP